MSPGKLTTSSPDFKHGGPYYREDGQPTGVLLQDASGLQKYGGDSEGVQRQ